MHKVDRLLFAIVAGVLGLVLIAFIIVLTRPKPVYLPDDAPGGVVHNYLLALETGDDSRAYRYVSPIISGYPRNLDAFRRSIAQESYVFSSLQTASLEVGNSTVSGETATVSVIEHNAGSGNNFGSQDTSTTITFNLRRNSDTGAWQIQDATNFWAYCWQAIGGCQ